MSANKFYKVKLTKKMRSPSCITSASVSLSSLSRRTRSTGVAGMTSSACDGSGVQSGVTGGVATRCDGGDGRGEPRGVGSGVTTGVSGIC